MNIKEHYNQRSYGYYIWIINLVSICGLVLAILSVPKGLVIYAATIKYWYVITGICVLGLFIDEKKRLLIIGMIIYGLLYRFKYALVFQATGTSIGAGK